MDSVVSSELLGTIFQYGTPMHDGAVIIQLEIRLPVRLLIFHLRPKIFLVNMEPDIVQLLESVKLLILLRSLSAKKQETFLWL